MRIVDVYGGSGIVALNCVNDIIIYNDLFDGLYNFFKVLREETSNKELIKKLQLTPYCEKEYQVCRQGWKQLKDPLEKARYFFVATMQSINAIGAMNPNQTWRRTHRVVRRGMAQNVSSWLRKVDEYLPDVIEKLRTIQVTNDDAIVCIKRWDNNETIFYLDPPYIQETRNEQEVYALEYSYDDHLLLIETLRNLKGSAVLSGYALDDVSPYDCLLDLGWKKEVIKEVSKSSSLKTNGNRKDRGKEVIWYKID